MKMRFLIFIIVFQSCTHDQSEIDSPTKNFGFLDSIKMQTKFARLQFQTNYPNGNVLLEARQFVGKNQLDTLFSFIGDQIIDTIDNSNKFEQRIGKVSFSDNITGETDLIELNIFSNEKFEGFNEITNGNSHSFKFTPLGKKVILAWRDSIAGKLKL